jgi:3-phosphoshikimate 1-carboxyvinyltransferase
MTSAPQTSYPAQLSLPPVTRAAGDVTLPGSKSISNRTLLLAALAKGTTTVRNLLKSDDTDVMLAALKTLGVEIAALGGNDYRVNGCGGDFPVKEATLFLGNAGTAFRPLTAALALQRGRYTLDGVPRMRERPIGDLVDALTALGADIRYAQQPGYPPLVIAPFVAKPVAAVNVRGDVSSQFLSAILMALPLLPQSVAVEVVGELISKPYVDITRNLMASFGVNVEHQDWRAFSAKNGSKYAPIKEIHVEGDASSASYFLAAGALGGAVTVHGVGSASIQGDVKFADALAAMGATIEMGENWIRASPPRRADGDSAKLRSLDMDFNHIPDAAMTIAVLALFAEGTTTLRNIASWRVKETDRISAMACELRKVGATVEEGSDYLKVTPPEKLVAGQVIHTYDDHRMAMCFSLVSLGGVDIIIDDPKCVAKTFPTYFSEFQRIVS